MSAVDISNIVADYPNAGRDALIPLLQAVQQRDGFLSPQSIVGIAKHLNLSPSKVYGVATFYNQFRFSAPGKCHIQVCRGTACHVKGSASVLDTVRRLLSIEPGQTTRDGVFSLEVVACMGACGLAPLICCDGDFHASVSPQQAEKIVKQYRKKVEGK